MLTVYGLCKHHVETGRRHLKYKTLSHDAVMGHLKSVYEARKDLYNTLTAEGRPLPPSLRHPHSRYGATQ
jgi:hypothetical protein